MECNKDYQMLFLSGELEGKDLEKFKKHIESCKECKKSIRFEQNIYAGLNNNLKEPPSHFEDSIINKLDSKNTIIKKINLKFLAVAASIAISLIVSVNFYDNADYSYNDLADFSNIYENDSIREGEISLEENIAEELFAYLEEDF